jgi:glycosyltransferase involved in cell wall biosynthesis
VLFLAGGSAGTHVYGAEQSLLHLVQGMDRTRFSPCCAVTQGDGPYVGALRGLGVPAVDLRLPTGAAISPAGLLATARGVRDLTGVTWRTRADLIHVNALKLNHYAVLAGRALGLPVVLHLQGHVRRRAYFTRLACAATRIVACSQSVAAPWQAISGARRRLRVIYYGLDPSAYAPSPRRRAEERARLGLAPDAFAVGVVSRLSPSKKLETFFQALRHAIAADGRIVALIAGDAPPHWRQYGENIRQLPRQMGISGHVVFLGYVNNIASLYSAFDAVVVPSDVEGLCRVVLEAMAASRPVIAVRAGGPVELIEEGVTGLLVPPHDPKSLAGEMVGLARDTALCQRLGEAARRRVAERFSLAAYLHLFHDVYREVLAAPRRERRWACLASR